MTTQTRGPDPTPRWIDVCHGDADGLCAVLQWRLADPRPAALVTGLKRDIGLLDRVEAGRGDEVLVCDLSMRRNGKALARLLGAGARVRWFDHHEVDEVPVHPGLEAHLDTSSETCASLLVDRHLQGAFRAWALVGAYGDNLIHVADRLAAAAGLGAEDGRRLRVLGEAINYNAYGEKEEVVLISPADLYETLARYRDPLEMIEQESIAWDLETLRQEDFRHATAWPPPWSDAHGSVHLLPDAPWSRRVIGSFANELAATQPNEAHAVIKATSTGDYEVSVRAPLAFPSGSAALCRRFGGDGRAGAAGIEHLPVQLLDAFVQAFSETPWRVPASAAHL
ncbi:MAG TPA: hypothetical protein VJ600_10890 [Holophagaceae bacterium]|nr:hypothetical protein [Holophagaceae bacterium]